MLHPIRPAALGLGLLLAVTAACGPTDADTAANAPAPIDSAALALRDTAQPEAPPPVAARDKAPDAIRGIYLNAYAAGSPTRLPKLLKMADESEINTFVIDVKDEKGIRYRTDIPLARELAQSGEVTIRDMKALTDSLRAHEIYSMARIVVFKDPILSKAKPDWSVRKPGGGLWTDKAGNTWVSPWDKRVWDYNISIAEEVAKAGFDEVQFDYVRFAEPYKSLPPQVHAQAQGDRTDAIAAFLNEAKRRLHPLGVPVAADVFGLTPNDPGDVNIGQQWETISSTADHILPMMYPSHYLPTHLPGVPRPNRMPYETVYKSAGMAEMRNERLREAGVKPARIIPWIQAFSAPWVDKNYPYGAEQAAAQIRGVYDAGLNDWVFWHPGSKYEPIAAAFAKTAEPQHRKYTPPEDVLTIVDRFEKQGVKEARERAAEQAAGRTTNAAAAKAASTGEAEPESPGS